MNQIDKLLIRARKSVRPSIYSAFCIVDLDDTTGKWRADPRLWDGVPGSGFMDTLIPADWVREYNTAAEAADAVNKLFETFDIKEPNRVVVLIDDVGV